MSFPKFEQIQKWSDEKLLNVINTGNSINWDIRLDESIEELDNYMSDLFNEKDHRKI